MIFKGIDYITKDLLIQADAESNKATADALAKKKEEANRTSVDAQENSLPDTSTPQGKADEAARQAALVKKTEDAKKASLETSNSTASTYANASVGTDVPNNSVFSLDVKCFLEGVQVPQASVSVSYGLNSPPTCTLAIPATNIIRDLPESTKIHVFFKDLLPTSEGVYEWRLLFDGELSSYSYSVSAEGAYVSLNGIHSSAYISLMQIMSLDIAEFINNPNQTIIGQATIPLLLGQNKVNSSIIERIIKGNVFASMADIVYQLMKAVITGVANSATGKYYESKLGAGVGAWKMLSRIYGVSKAAADKTYAYDPGYTATGSSGGSGSISANGYLFTDDSMGSNCDSQFLGWSDYVARGASLAGVSRYYTTTQLNQHSTDSYQGHTKDFLAMLDNLTDDYRAYSKNNTFVFTITSGYRDPVINGNTANSATNSRHMTGEAVDIDNTMFTAQQLFDLVNFAVKRKFFCDNLKGFADGDDGHIHLGYGG